jgi:dynactin complex subunit
MLLINFCYGSKVQERHGTAEDRIQRLESQLEEKSTEVAKLQQRLRINEEHNSRLSSTVDKLLQGKFILNNCVNIGRLLIFL